MTWWRRDLGREARWDLPIPGRRVVGLFFCVSGDEVLAKVVGAYVCLGLGGFEMLLSWELIFVV